MLKDHSHYVMGQKWVLIRICSHSDQNEMVYRDPNLNVSLFIIGAKWVLINSDQNEMVYRDPNLWLIPEYEPLWGCMLLHVVL